MKIKYLNWSVILMMLSCSSYADEAFQRNYGISFSNSSTLELRKFVGGSYMFYAAFGLDSSENKYAYNYNENKSVSNSYGLGLGARKYLATDTLSHFIDFETYKTYARLNSDTGGDGNLQRTILYLTFGVEYNFSSAFSVEGKAGIFYSTFIQTDNVSTYSNNSVTTPAATVAVNYYWK